MSDDKTKASRRDLLKFAGVGLPAAAAAAVGAAPGATAAPEEAGSGLRDTPHVRKVMELARF